MTPQGNEWNSQPKNHEDRIAGKGFTSMTDYNMVHKFIPMPQAMNIPGAKAAADKEWKNAWNKSTMDFEKNQEQKKEFLQEAQRDKKKVCFATPMATCRVLLFWDVQKALFLDTTFRESDAYFGKPKMVWEKQKPFSG